MPSDAKLVGVTGVLAGQSFPIELAPLILGRSPDAEVSVPTDALVSRNHAQLCFKGDTVWIKDLGSSNGTWLNGQRLGGPTQLSDGDRIGIGSQVLRFDQTPVPKSAAPTPTTQTAKQWLKRRPLAWLVIALALLIASGAWYTWRKSMAGPVGLWIEPILSESAYEFKPGGDFIEHHVRDPAATIWTWSEVRGHYWMDGNRLYVEYSPGQHTIGRDSWVVTNQTDKSLSLLQSWGESLDLAAVEALPSRRPPEEWKVYQMGSGPPQHD